MGDLHFEKIRLVDFCYEKQREVFHGRMDFACM